VSSVKFLLRSTSALPFFLLHLGALGALFFPFKASYLLWIIGLYYARMFAVTAGYHRYFSHRSYRMNRFWQFCMAFLAESSAQKGVLWWAAHHRYHHQHSDKDTDIHSPRRHGFWRSHVGWIISHDYDEYDPKLIQDYGKFPELRFINSYNWIPPLALAVGVLALGGWPLFFWGFLPSTVLLYHGTFTINSLAHIWGSRRFETEDDSRNNFFLSLVTLGEGWHNNHHHYMHACRQGLYWWEIDITYYLLTMLSWVGVVRDMRQARPSAMASS
jgi:stearoyl-CoA desaturase (Delta-9 desaturase)